MLRACRREAGLRGWRDPLFLPIGIPPVPQSEKNGRQRPAEGGQLILDLGWHLRMDVPVDDAVGFQLSKLQGEHSLGRVRNTPGQLHETQLPRHEVKEDKRLPKASNHGQGNLDRAAAFRIMSLWSHPIHPLMIVLAVIVPSFHF